MIRLILVNIRRPIPTLLKMVLTMKLVLVNVLPAIELATRFPRWPVPLLPMWFPVVTPLTLVRVQVKFPLMCVRLRLATMIGIRSCRVNNRVTRSVTSLVLMILIPAIGCVSPPLGVLIGCPVCPRMRLKEHKLVCRLPFTTRLVRVLLLVVKFLLWAVAPVSVTRLRVWQGVGAEFPRWVLSDVWIPVIALLYVVFWLILACLMSIVLASIPVVYSSDLLRKLVGLSTMLVTLRLRIRVGPSRWPRDTGPLTTIPVVPLGLTRPGSRHVLFYFGTRFRNILGRENVVVFDETEWQL